MYQRALILLLLRRILLTLILSRGQAFRNVRIRWARYVLVSLIVVLFFMIRRLTVILSRGVHLPSRIVVISFH